MKLISFPRRAAMVSEREKSAGFTLTEVAIVLGIIGIILGAIWAAASMVYKSNRNKIMATEVLTVVNNWKSIYGSKRVDVVDGTDITMETVNNGFAPSDMIVPNAPTGACTVGGTTTPCYMSTPGTVNHVNITADQTNNGVGVTFSFLTPAECNYLANSLNPTSSGVALMQINSNAQSLFPPIGTAAPLTSADISAQCTAAGAANTLLLGFLMK